MKPLKNLLTILLILLPLSAYAWGVVATSGGVAAPAPAGEDHTVTLSSASSAWTIGNGTSGSHVGTRITIPTTGTVKSITVCCYTDGTSSTMTLRWKKNSADLGTSPIDTLTSGAITSGTSVTFDVTDTEFTAGDYLYVGLEVSGYGHLKAWYTTSATDDEIGLNSGTASSWDMNDAVSAPTRDMCISYVLNY